MIVIEIFFWNLIKNMNLNTFEAFVISFSCTLLATYINWPIRENSKLERRNSRKYVKLNNIYILSGALTTKKATMGLDFDLHSFIEDMRACKPPYKCPLKHCGKVCFHFLRLQKVKFNDFILT